MNDTGKIQKALTKLMGEKPDSFLLAVQELRGGRKWGK